MPVTSLPFPGEAAAGQVSAVGAVLVHNVTLKGLLYTGIVIVILIAWYEVARFIAEHRPLPKQEARLAKLFRKRPRFFAEQRRYPGVSLNAYTLPKERIIEIAEENGYRLRKDDGLSLRFEPADAPPDDA